MLSTRAFASPCAHVRARVARKPAVRATALLGGLFSTQKPGTEEDGFYGFAVKDIDGKNVSMSSYKGKVVLIVNTASACGFTPQYAELQGLQDKYGRKGFTVLGFPCNQFGAQEPGNGGQIKQFAKSQYGVTFPLFSKLDVNGPNADPLFDFLKDEKKGLFGSADIKWNFSKFLVDKEGNVVGRYAPTTTPASLEKEIEKLIAA